MAENKRNTERNWKPRNKAVIQPSKNTRSAGTSRLSSEAAQREKELIAEVLKRNKSQVGPDVKPTHKQPQSLGSRGLARYGEED